MDFKKTKSDLTRRPHYITILIIAGRGLRVNHGDAGTIFTLVSKDSKVLEKLIERKNEKNREEESYLCCEDL